MGIILASGSPRRKELLELMGLADFQIIPAQGEPEISGLSPDETVCALALYKARSVQKDNHGHTIIAADTLVYLDGEALGKPKDEEDARRMLTALSGRGHQVYTGVCILTPEKSITCAERTDVYFRTMTDAEIDGYIATGEPMDKAGAYGAQGKAAVFIEGINGDFFNVMGLPVCRLKMMAKAIGAEL